MGTLLEKINLIPKLISERHLLDAWTLYEVEAGDILCMAGSKSLLFTKCALNTITDEDIISYAALTDHQQFIEEVQFRGLMKQVDLTQYGLVEFFPPKKLIKALSESR